MPTIIEMVNHTRLDCVHRLRRRACARRSRRRSTTPRTARAFGKRLIEQPLMQNVLADLCVESEAATAAMMRLARAYDAGAERRPAERRFARLATAVVQVLGLQARAAARRRGARVPRRQRLRRGVDHAAPLPRGAAQRDLGGLGQRHLPRRAARHGAGAGVGRRPSSTRSSTRARRRRRARRAPSTGCARELDATSTASRRARAAAGRAHGAGAAGARCWCATRPPAVADAFCASRLAGDRGRAFGTLPAGRRLRRDRRAAPAAVVGAPLTRGPRAQRPPSASRGRSHGATAPFSRAVPFRVGISTLKVRDRDPVHAGAGMSPAEAGARMGADPARALPPRCPTGGATGPSAGRSGAQSNP